MPKKRLTLPPIITRKALRTALRMAKLPLKFGNFANLHALENSSTPVPGQARKGKSVIDVLESLVYEACIQWARSIDKRVSALERVAVKWDILETTIDAARDILHDVERKLAAADAEPGTTPETLRAVKADGAAIHEKIDLLIAWSA